MEVLHLNFLPGTGAQLNRLQVQLRKSDAPALREAADQWADSGLGELALAIATRRLIVVRAAHRLGSLLKSLRDEIAASGDLEELLAEGFAYNPENGQISYDICAAFDSCVFELRSFYEIVGAFARRFGHVVLDRSVDEKEILAVLEGAGAKIDWVQPLRENRKLFFHETAPWIALRIHQRHPLECSLLVMKRNLRSFHDAEDFVTQRELVDTIGNLQIAVSRILQWLEAEVETRELELLGSAG